MRRQSQRHLVPADVDVGMVVALFGPHGDPVHEADRLGEAFELEPPADGLAAFRPLGERFQLAAYLFGVQGLHLGEGVGMAPGVVVPRGLPQHITFRGHCQRVARPLGRRYWLRTWSAARIRNT